MSQTTYSRKRKEVESAAADEQATEKKKTYHEARLNFAGKTCEVNQLKAGDYLSVTNYYKVTRSPDDEHPDRVAIVDMRGHGLTVSSGIVETENFSASQYSRTEQLTQTELIHKFLECGDAVFSVMYEKKLNNDEVGRKLYELKDDPTQFKTLKACKAVAKGLLCGEERQLIGFRVSTGEEQIYARSMCIDLTVEEPERKGIRLVDHRTIRSLIVHNVRYVLKK